MVLEHVRAELRTVLGFIAAAPPEPLLFHCVAGKDRTGLIAALLLALADATPAAIAHDYAVSAENLRDGYLRRYPDADRERILEALRCPEEGAYNMLEFLERSGGVRAYLEQIGLSAAEIVRLRARLRD
ncbi:MAG: tyrosine-protein phosphatase [Gammaproteobacteria bacterium]|nr:tyrosine-protein phosphatase [Gammaproteobacteria bacterium]